MVFDQHIAAYRLFFADSRLRRRISTRVAGNLHNYLSIGVESISCPGEDEEAVIEVWSGEMLVWSLICNNGMVFERIGYQVEEALWTGQYTMTGEQRYIFQQHERIFGSLRSASRETEGGWT